MKLATRALLTLALIPLTTFSRGANAVPLGPFDVTIELCQNIQLVSSVVSAWSNAAFPVTGTPGFAIMTVQRTSPLLDLCNFIVQLKNADTTEAIFLTAENLNDVTEQKWDDYLRLTKKSYQIANSFYDFNSGQKRQGTVEATQLAQDMGEFQKMVTDLYTGDNPQAVKQRQEHDRQISEFAQTAHERAILKEGTDCPGGDPNAPDYYDKIKSDYTPQEKIKNDTDLEIAFIRSRLIDMGGQFLSEIKEVATYMDDTQNLFVLGVYYRVSDSSKTVKTVKPTGKELSDGTAEKKSVSLNQSIQSFDALTDEKVFSQFKSKYDARYRAFAARKWEELAKLPDAKDKMKEFFQGMAYDCNESKLMAGYSNLSQDEYERMKVERFRQCEANSQITREAALNMMTTYLQNLKLALQRNKKAQGAMWTFESKYMGRKRSISREKSGNSFQESVVCAKAPEMIDLEMIQAKQQAVNAKYNETIARETLKESMVRDEEMSRQKKMAQETKAKQRIIEQNKVVEENAYGAHATIDMGGTGAGN